MYDDEQYNLVKIMKVNEEMNLNEFVAISVSMFFRAVEKYFPRKLIIALEMNAILSRLAIHLFNQC